MAYSLLLDIDHSAMHMLKRTFRLYNQHEFQVTIMDLTQEDVLQILRIMDESDYEQLHLEVGELKLVVSKRGVSGLSVGEQDLSVPVRINEPATVEKPVQTDRPTEKPRLKENVGVEDEATELEGLIPIRSPMLGTFYRSPKPGDPSFVEQGQVVDEETTVCVIEVMKLFSTIHAGVRGRIARICADDGQLVEYNQVLFLVEPQTDKEEG